jgi:tRNA(His) 5'-end guanylyltransferase
MKDGLGDRMKKYENITRTHLMPRSYTIIRVDGKAFHTFTRKFERPFDMRLISMMSVTALYLAQKIQGCKIAFVQSDEISLLLTDFDELNTSAWFDGNIQKIASVSASMATHKFIRAHIHYLMEDYFASHWFSDANIIAAEREMVDYFDKVALAEFDSRTYTIPTKTEVMNYFIWRQKDAERNSVAMVAQSMFSHKELQGKSTNQMQEMMFQNGTNWNDYNDGVKRGRVIKREPVPISVPVEDLKAISKPMYNTTDGMKYEWGIYDSPEFVKNRDYLNKLIPNNE